MKKILQIIIACILLCGTALAQTRKVPLESAWEFHEYHGSKPELAEWRSATVPGLVHTDLLAHKLIPDPFYRDNESKVQWVSNAEWEYRRTITADQNLLMHKHIDMVFEGLNTIAEVSLNGKVVLHADNMFREWRVDIRSYLVQGTNALSIIFHCIKPELVRLDKAHPEEKEGADTSAVAKMFDAGNKSYVRKAAYEGGWDWGPNMVTCGIWRPVYLQCWEDERIADLGIQQSDISSQAAHINVDVRVLSTVKADASLKVEYAQGSQTKSFSYPVSLHTGINEISYPIDIANPKLWYPNGYGKQDMYHFEVTLLAGGHAADVVSTSSGLRSVRLNRERDSLGRKFEFIVNGVPVFAKGANIIPFDHFPTRMTADRYHHYLQAAADAHMNMMRLWGGGYFETQEFYNLCDKLGILIWQDFMFANATPPSFLKEDIAKEIDYQVRRLRNHPCIAVWCGNNEISIFLEKLDPNLIPDAFKPLFEKLAATRTSKTYTDYLEIFNYLIPGVVNKLTPEISYTSSSPTSDFELQSPPNYVSGDRHNYSVWWNSKPIEDQANYKDRFVSETGIQGFPDLATINAFTEVGDRSATSPIMNAHQKNAMVNGNTVIGKIIKTEYKDPADFATFDYLAQLVQGESLKIYAEAMRRRRPFSMGFIYWQLNDSWPVISWSTMDYYGRPKAGMYMAKHFFEPVLVSPHEEDGRINIYTVSDLTADEDATLEAKLMDFDGKVLWTKKAETKVKALSSGIALSIPDGELAGIGYDPERTFITTKLVNARDEVLSSNQLYFKQPKDLKYTKAAVQTDLSRKGDHYVLKLSSSALAPRVEITFGDEEVSLSDNYIDVLPNEPVLISIKSHATLEQLKNTLKIKSLDQL